MPYQRDQREIKNRSLKAKQSRDFVALEALIKKQQNRLPDSIKELKTHGRKTGHWIWWCMPTAKAGMAEPGEPTYVTNETALLLLENAANDQEQVWRNCLELIVEIVEKELEEIEGKEGHKNSKKHDSKENKSSKEEDSLTKKLKGMSIGERKSFASRGITAGPSSKAKTISKIPKIDHGRIYYFLEFWSNLQGIDDVRDKWLMDCCETLKRYNWEPDW